MTISTSAFVTPSGISIKNPRCLLRYLNAISWNFMTTDWDLTDPCIVYRVNQRVNVEVQDTERIIDLTMAGINVYSFNDVEAAYDCIKYLYIHRKEDPELVILNNRSTRGPRRRA